MNPSCLNGLPVWPARAHEQQLLARVVRVANGQDDEARDQVEAAAFLAAARLKAIRFPTQALRLQHAGLARWPEGEQIPTHRLLQAIWGGDRLRLADALQRYFTPGAATPYPREEPQNQGPGLGSR